jgi:hypothetical protein
MPLFNTLSRLQWAVLFLCVAFIPPTVYAAPKASFFADRYSGLGPLFVVVDCRESSPWKGTDRITRFEWTTSNDTLIKNQIRVGILLSVGTQTITLTVWNAAGEKDSETKTFKVCNEYGAECPEPPPPPPPNSSNGSGSTGSTGSTASFNVVQKEGLTVHLEASGLQTGLMYEYRVRLETDISPSSYYFNTEEYSIKLPEAGTYKISLYVPKKDDSGWDQLQAETVTVPKTAPDPVVITPPPVGGDEAFLEFRGLEGSYNIGDRVTMELVETGNRSTPVDLWVAIEFSEKFWYRTKDSWSEDRAPYKKTVKSTDKEHTFDFDFPKEEIDGNYIVGDYTLYAVYVAEDGEPITIEGAYNEPAFRSNPVTKNIQLQEAKTGPEPQTPPDENLAKLKFDGLKDSYNVGETVTMELVETGNRETPVDLWVAIQLPLPSGEILFRTDVPMPLSFWTPWSPNLQPHKTSIKITDTNHDIFEFELPEGIGGNYTLYAVYVEEGEKPVTNIKYERNEENKGYDRSNLVIRPFFLVNKKE